VSLLLFAQASDCCLHLLLSPLSKPFPFSPLLSLPLLHLLVVSASATVIEIYWPIVHFAPAATNSSCCSSSYMYQLYTERNSFVRSKPNRKNRWLLITFTQDFSYQIAQQKHSMNNSKLYKLFHQKLENKGTIRLDLPN